MKKNSIMNLSLGISCFMCFCLLFSCSKDSNEDNNEESSFYLNSDVNLSLVNENGEDLLNSTTEGYFSDIQLYYVVDGEKIKAQEYDSQCGGENGTLLITETTPYKLRCFTYDYYESISDDSGEIFTGTSIALLELSSEITDTITTEWETNLVDYFTVTKVWYNGELKSIDESFTIIK